jgi:hypothetical protein
MNWDLMTLFIKIGGLLSACGGPMLVMDRLKGRLGNMPAFFVGFIPIALMMIGAFHLAALAGDRWARRAVELGLVGMYVMVTMQLCGIWLILGGLRSPALPLYYVGIATGLLAAVIYQMAAARWLARDGAVSPESSPHDHRPIEPS